MYWPMFASLTLKICRPGRVWKIFIDKLCATCTGRLLIWLSYVHIFGWSIIFKHFSARSGLDADVSEHAFFPVALLWQDKPAFVLNMRVLQVLLNAQIRFEHLETWKIMMHSWKVFKTANNDRYVAPSILCKNKMELEQNIIRRGHFWNNFCQLL